MEKFITPLSMIEKLNSELSPKVIDVRSPEEYEQGHVPGAQNIPIDQLMERILEIPKN